MKKAPILLLLTIFSIAEASIMAQGIAMHNNVMAPVEKMPFVFHSVKNGEKPALKPSYGFTEKSIVAKHYTPHYEVLVHYLDFNTGYAEFSPQFFGDGIVFCSGYPKDGYLNRQVITKNSGFLDLYYIDSVGFAPYSTQSQLPKYQKPQLKKASYKNVTSTTNDSPIIDYENVYVDQVDPSLIKPGALRATSFSPDINTGYHEGPMVFTNDQNTIFFTRNNYHEGKLVKGKKNTSLLQLFSAEKNPDGSWANIQHLPFNKSSSSAGHPALSPDDQILYFVSDRFGGYGGTDIYRVTRNKSGNWGRPENLGTPINTPGNEVFPFMDKGGNLYFSSDGHEKSLGGLDIYKYKDDTLYHLNTPFNSSFDDFSYIVTPDNSFGYFSSDRREKGNDDIYYFEHNEIWVNGDVVEKQSKKPLPNAKIEIYETTGYDNMVATVFSDDEGRFSVRLDPCKQYGFIAYKDDFIQSDKKYTSKCHHISQQKLRLELLFFNITALAYDKVTGKPLEGVKITARHNQELHNWQTDAKGKALLFENHCMSLQIKGELKGYNSTSARIAQHCDESGELIVELPMQPQVLPQITTEMIPLSKDENFDIISKPVVYYDFDESVLRPASIIKLDSLAGILISHPDWSLILNSYTDAQGTESYNKSLSHMRTISVARYLMKKGISLDRISRDWHGEKNLVNNCGNGQDCSEQQHQLNRRTEIIIKNNKKS